MTSSGITQHNVNSIRSSMIRWSTIVSALAILEAALLAQALRTTAPPITVIESNIETIRQITVAQKTPPVTAPPVETAAPTPLSGARITLRGNPAIHVSMDFSLPDQIPAISKLAQIAPSSQIDALYLVGKPETQWARDQYRLRITQEKFARAAQIHLQKMTRDFENLPGLVIVLKQGAL